MIWHDSEYHWKLLYWLETSVCPGLIIDVSAMGAVGKYYRTLPEPCRDRVKAYTAPPFPGTGGQYITTLKPGITIGPVTQAVQTRVYITVCVHGYWMNIAKIGRWGTLHWFAHKLTEQEIADWRRRGWRDL